MSGARIYRLAFAAWCICAGIFVILAWRIGRLFL